jgi:hypothetical protein
MSAYIKKAYGFYRANVSMEELRTLPDLQHNKGGEISYSFGE